MPATSTNELLETTQSLIAIESIDTNPDGIRAAYAHMYQFLLAHNHDITIEEFETGGKPSLLAYRTGERPERFHIMFNAHVDVVPGKPEQFVPHIENDKLYGRGAYDMKAAAIVLAEIFCEYVTRVPYALGIQIVTDEETAGERGTQYQIRHGVTADFIICGESGTTIGDHQIAHEAKGVVDLEIRLDGENVHAAYPWHGSNAAVNAAEFIQKLHERYPVPTEPTQDTTVTITGIETGDNPHNQTPDIATVRLNCRYAPNDSNFQTPATITQLIHTIDPNATIAHFGNIGAPMYTDPRNPLLLELKAAAEQVVGTQYDLVRRNGTGDGRFYTEVGGQACEFGIVGEGQHAEGEVITIEAFTNYFKIMRAFMEKTISLRV